MALTHWWRWLPRKVLTSTSGAVWVSVSVLPKDTMTCQPGESNQCTLFSMQCSRRICVQAVTVFFFYCPHGGSRDKLWAYQWHIITFKVIWNLWAKGCVSGHLTNMKPIFTLFLLCFWSQSTCKENVQLFSCSIQYNSHKQLAANGVSPLFGAEQQYRAACVICKHRWQQWSSIKTLSWGQTAKQGTEAQSKAWIELNIQMMIGRSVAENNPYHIVAKIFTLKQI